MKQRDTIDHGLKGPQNSPNLEERPNHQRELQQLRVSNKTYPIEYNTHSTEPMSTIVTINGYKLEAIIDMDVAVSLINPALVRAVLKLPETFIKEAPELIRQHKYYPIRTVVKVTIEFKKQILPNGPLYISIHEL